MSEVPLYRTKCCLECIKDLIDPEVSGDKWCKVRETCAVVSRWARIWGSVASCITQLRAQGPSRTCNESQEEEEEARSEKHSLP